MDGLNDAPEDAEAALTLFEPFPNEVRFNLLPMNPTGRGPRPSPPDRVARFLEILRSRGAFAKVRTARGSDEGAACGQLVTLASRS